jgi:RimJ/RimL family protein N-acetyltransferase
MQLVLERCALRPWRLDDAESLARHANNRKIWLGVRDLFPHPYTIQDAHEFLQRTISEASAMKFCIEIEGAAVGGIGVHPGEDVHRHTATVGYWLGEEFWGRGIMTEAVTVVTDFCFENFPLRRISAEVFANNPASASRTTSSKMGIFSIPCSTPGQSSSCEAATCAPVDQRRYGSPH